MGSERAPGRTNVGDTPARILYEGRRTTLGAKIVTDCGEDSIPLCLEICRHAESFEWGYSGSGAAQAALAVMYHHLTRFVRMRPKDAGKTAGRFHQSFKVQVIACLPELWLMDSRAVEEFRMMAIREGDGDPVSWPLWRASVFERGVIVATRGRPVIGGPP